MYKICIAGKNKCSIDIASFISNKISKKNLLILPNKSDKGIDGWQPSLRKYAVKNKITITNLKNIYNIKNLILISIEFEEILKVRKFKSKELFNIHFSLLPKYRGCHTNYLQIKNGEKKTGVTLHKIDSGIDTGEIIDQLKFKLNVNTNAFKNYNNLMTYSIKILKKNFSKLINKSYKTKKQNEKKSTYFNRSFVKYGREKFLNKKSNSINFHNRVRALIFPPFQLPILNKKKIINSSFLKKKVYLKYL